MVTTTPSRRAAFVGGCIMLLLSSFGGLAALAHASRTISEPAFATAALHICALSWIGALTAVCLVAFGRGWQRIVAEILAVSCFLYWTALMLIGD
jgi:hypothetical protein